MKAFHTDYGGEPISSGRVRSQHYSWGGGEMARLPWEKELGEILQGVKRARKLTVPP
ncbi:hypothetical protein HBHAL_5169 [Halobacillus halophilus DSM 2266]|uniref:Uncharacterized protein n=1 Tax=Halobacillus halophilus (strain ATCC 35676 / DSM 2266 / JCM 20832 / KCTC 3685 / LMG 17431 / NBRC 102448 / NCIMB 2269) TaxID=866895 RepID=I0JTN2_HALH3|nr:hypothetical protein HBHAL_5169 [Halobacillus halophilus DSM 2266]